MPRRRERREVTQARTIARLRAELANLADAYFELTRSLPDRKRLLYGVHDHLTRANRALRTLGEDFVDAPLALREKCDRLERTVEHLRLERRSDQP